MEWYERFFGMQLFFHKAQKRFCLLYINTGQKEIAPDKKYPVHPSQRLSFRRHPRRSQHRLQYRKQSRITAFPQKQHTGTPTKYNGLSSGVVFQAVPASSIFLCIYGFYRTPSKERKNPNFSAVFAGQNFSVLTSSMYPYMYRFGFLPNNNA